MLDEKVCAEHHIGVARVGEVAMLLAGNADARCEVWWSPQSIGDFLGIPRRDVRNALAVLAELRIAVRTGMRRDRVWVLRLDPDQWPGAVLRPSKYGAAAAAGKARARAEIRAMVPVDNARVVAEEVAEEVAEYVAEYSATKGSEEKRTPPTPPAPRQRPLWPSGVTDGGRRQSKSERRERWMTDDGRAGHPPHKSEQVDDPRGARGARPRLERLIAERQLPLTVEEALAFCYLAGHGDPWLGCRDYFIPATEHGLDGARDPEAVLRARLREAVRSAPSAEAVQARRLLESAGLAAATGGDW